MLTGLTVLTIGCIVLLRIDPFKHSALGLFLRLSGLIVVSTVAGVVVLAYTRGS